MLYKEEIEMDKKKKNIIAIALVAVIVIAIIVAVVVSKKGKNDTPQTNNPTAAQVETTVAAGNENVTTAENGNEDLPVAGDETTAKSSKNSKKSSKKGNKNNKETNYWDNISIIEETQNKEPKTNKKGETVTEEYPGQDDGWSPIVSPDDLEK